MIKVDKIRVYNIEKTNPPGHLLCPEGLLITPSSLFKTQNTTLQVVGYFLSKKAPIKFAVCVFQGRTFKNNSSPIKVLLGSFQRTACP